MYKDPSMFELILGPSIDGSNHSVNQVRGIYPVLALSRPSARALVADVAIARRVEDRAYRRGMKALPFSALGVPGAKL